MVNAAKTAALFLLALWGESGTGTRPGSAQRSRNPLDAAASNGAGNPPQGKREHVTAERNNGNRGRVTPPSLVDRPFPALGDVRTSAARVPAAALARERGDRGGLLWLRGEVSRAEIHYHCRAGAERARHAGKGTELSEVFASIPGVSGRAELIAPFASAGGTATPWRGRPQLACHRRPGGRRRRGWRRPGVCRSGWCGGCGRRSSRGCGSAARVRSTESHRRVGDDLDVHAVSAVLGRVVGSAIADAVALGECPVQEDDLWIVLAQSPEQARHPFGEQTAESGDVGVGGAEGHPETEREPGEGLAAAQVHQCDKRSLMRREFAAPVTLAGDDGQGDSLDQGVREVEGGRMDDQRGPRAAWLRRRTSRSTGREPRSLRIVVRHLIGGWLEEDHSLICAPIWAPLGPWTLLTRVWSMQCCELFLASLKRETLKGTGCFGGPRTSRRRRRCAYPCPDPRA